MKDIKYTGVWWGMAVAVAIWLLWMALRPGQVVADELTVLTTPAVTYGISPYVLIELAGNVVVFVPLGLAMSLALRDHPPTRRLLLAVAAGAGLSMIIELVQIALPSRSSAISDFVLNTVGTAIGTLVPALITNIQSKMNIRRFQ